MAIFEGNTYVKTKKSYIIGISNSNDLYNISRLVVMVVLLVIWIISTTVALPPTLNSTTFTINSSRWISSPMEVVMVMMVALGVAVIETVFVVVRA